MSAPKIKNKKATLARKFAFIIVISVAFSVFFISTYNIYASATIVESYKVEKDHEFNSISNLIHDRFKTDYFEETNFMTFRSFIDNLINNNLVLHVGLINNLTHEYEWSSIRELEGTRAISHNLWINKGFKKYFGHLTKDDVFLKTYQINNNTVVVVFHQNKVLLNLINILKIGNYLLAGLFIIFAFLFSFLLAKQVTQPIEKLVIGVWEFSKGNMSYRTTIKTDDEIGILAKAFNYMAEKLDELYTSMEKKVKERTKELSSKNDELNSAYKELKDAQSQLVHNEKMRSLGELVAGVAHELNNPINFIYGNMTHLKEYSNNLIKIVSQYESLQQESEGDKYKEVEDYKEEIDYKFLKDDILKLIQSCAGGAERSKQIILELKDFSRLDQSVIKEIDINESIDSTLNILKSKYKDKVNIIKEYGDIPMFDCYAGQMNQVFMNILDNATQSVKGAGDVIIRTKTDDINLLIEFEDTGEGIEQDILSQIFDPFFTTKPVGSGSGLGLSITYKIIKSHNGIINVESEIGKGTKFTIKIPLNWRKLILEEKPESEEETKEEMKAAE